MNWPYVVLAFLCLFIFGLCDNMRGPIYPELLDEFHVSNSFGSWFYAITSAFSFVGSWACIHTLRLIDRIQNIYFALIILFVGLVGQGLSESFVQLLLAAACTGLGLGFLGVSNNLLATIGSSPRFRQRVLSGLHSVYALSSLVAPLIVTLIYSQGAGWRECFFAAAGLCVLVLVGGFIYQKKEDGVEFKSESTPRQNSLHGILLLAVAVASYVMGEILVSSRLALYLRTVKAYNLQESSLYLTGFFVGLLGGRLLFSFYQPRTHLFFQLIGSLVVTVFVMILGLQVHEGFLMLTGFTMGPFFPLAVNYIAESFPFVLNRAMAFTVSVQSLFVVVMHLSFGWLTDQFGIISAMWAGPAVFCISGALLIGFRTWTKN